MKKTILIICTTIIITVICCSIVFFVGFNEGQNKSEINQNISNKEDKELEKFIGIWKYKSCEYDLDESQIQSLIDNDININDLKSVNITVGIGDYSLFINNNKLLIIYPNHTFYKSVAFKVGAFKINDDNINSLIQIDTTDEDIEFLNNFSNEHLSFANCKFEKLSNYNIIYEK